jgi:transposase
VSGIGAIIALTFRAFIDDVTRFRDAGHVNAGIGLAVREPSSGERRLRCDNSKAGPTELWSLLMPPGRAGAHRAVPVEELDQPARGAAGKKHRRRRARAASPSDSGGGRDESVFASPLHAAQAAPY